MTKRDKKFQVFRKIKLDPEKRARDFQPFKKLKGLTANSIFYLLFINYLRKFFLTNAISCLSIIE